MKPRGRNAPREKLAAPSPHLVTQPIESSRTRLLIVDSEELVRIGLRTLLQNEPDLEIVGEAATEAEMAAQMQRTTPDVVLLQYPFSGLPILDLNHLWNRPTDPPRTILLLLNGWPSLVRRAIQTGAQGIVVKTTSKEELLRAIREVAGGRPYLDQELAQPAMSLIREEGHEETFLSAFSSRERQILPLIAEGRTNKEIAALLALSEKTVKSNISHLIAKLGFVRRSQVAAFYVTRRQSADMRGDGKEPIRPILRAMPS